MATQPLTGRGQLVRGIVTDSKGNMVRQVQGGGWVSRPMLIGSHEDYLTWPEESTEEFEPEETEYVSDQIKLELEP